MTIQDQGGLFDLHFSVGKWRVHLLCFKSFKAWKFGVGVGSKKYPGFFSNVGPILFDVIGYWSTRA